MILATPKKKIDSKKKKKGFGFEQLKNVANSDTRCDKIYHDQWCRCGSRLVLLKEKRCLSMLIAHCSFASTVLQLRGMRILKASTKKNGLRSQAGRRPSFLILRHRVVRSMPSSPAVLLRFHPCFLSAARRRSRSLKPAFSSAGKSEHRPFNRSDLRCRR